MLLRLLFSLCCTAFLAHAAYAATFIPEGDIIGAVTQYRVHDGDNLYEIARRRDIGIVEMLAANPGIDPWMPPPGTLLTITGMHILPAVPRKGIVINLSELRLFYFAGDGSVLSFPIGIGREGWETPAGKTSIIRKRKNPVWIPPESIREENPDLPEIFPAGPDNPLGEYAMDTGWRGYVIHGTNRPYGVGKRSSHGCIRLYPEDIETLFEAVEAGTPVAVVDMPYKLGWQGNTLFLEVTPTQDQADVIAEYREPVPFSIPEIYDAIQNIAGEETEIRWYDVEEAIARRSGIPAVIGQKVAAALPENLPKR